MFNIKIEKIMGRGLTRIDRIKYFVVLKKKIWDADERRFTGFIKLFKKQKRTGGMGGNLRQSAKICVLLKFTIFTRRLY